ncbi:MAG: hypothetical protein ACJA2B_001511 [Candidatus Endobugula sp.]|jgi:hypothetical protein
MKSMSAGVLRDIAEFCFFIGEHFFTSWSIKIDVSTEVDGNVCYYYFIFY